MPKVSVNYSHPAAALLHQGRITVEVFKSPSWSDLISSIREVAPVYVHFPLRVGAGIGDAIDTETDAAPNWHHFEQLLTETATPFVNVHLAPTTSDHLDVPRESMRTADVEHVTEALIRDVEALVSRFGAGRVIVENDHDNGERLLQAFRPDVIATVVDATGCGLLLDVAHARLAARELALNETTYLQSLPLAQTREIHVAGIQFFDDDWVTTLRTAGFNESLLQRFAGQWLDHLPMTEEDWTFYGWALDYLLRDVGALPWVVTLEYGGVGPVFGPVSDPTVIERDINRLRQLVSDCR